MEGSSVGPFRSQVQLVLLAGVLAFICPALFQRQASKSIDVKIAVAEENLTRAHKTLQDLKIKR